MTVAVLFARADSIYKQLPGCDVWDIERDARTWPGGSPVVAHPPCRAWASLRHHAKPREGEKDLALLAIKRVRQNGGVLEHPLFSTLWKVAGLPEPGQRDEFGEPKQVWHTGMNLRAAIDAARAAQGGRVMLTLFLLGLMWLAFVALTGKF